MALHIHPDGQIQVNGRWLRVGSEVSITGQRGRFRYTGQSRSSSGRLILHFIGGPPNHEMIRSFYPERIGTVHNARG